MAEDEETQTKSMIAIYIANNNYNSLENMAHLDSTYAWKATVVIHYEWKHYTFVRIMPRMHGDLCLIP
jgi:hypothetical protein